MPPASRPDLPLPTVRFCSTRRYPLLPDRKIRTPAPAPVARRDAAPGASAVPRILGAGVHAAGDTVTHQRGPER